MKEKFYALVEKILLKIYGCRMPQINNTPSVPKGEFRVYREEDYEGE